MRWKHWTPSIVPSDNDQISAGTYADRTGPRHPSRQASVAVRAQFREAWRAASARPRNSRQCVAVLLRRPAETLEFGDPEATAHVSALRAAAMAAARCSLLVVIFVGSIKGELLQRVPNPSEARRDRSKPSGALQKFLDCGSSRCPGAAPALKCGDPGIPSRRQKSASSRFIIGC